MKLSPDLLISAYSQGIFPMGVDGEIQWFSPERRAVLPLERFHASKTLRQTCRQGVFQVRVNAAFGEVMEACSDRPEGTWITNDIIRAYSELHRLGLAHSVEAWRQERLAGGLYGVALGGAFFGESMFHRGRDASKVALVALVSRLKERGFRLLDLQYMTDHLRKFGAVEVSRVEYLRKLAAAIRLQRLFVDP